MSGEQSEANTDAERKACEAINCLSVAEHASSRPMFADVGELIAIRDCKHAAKTLITILSAHNKYPHAGSEIRAAQRAVRDIAVIRLRSEVPTQDPEAFWRQRKKPLVTRLIVT